MPTLKNRLYYHLKPVLPWQLRMGVRRLLAQGKRKRHADTWPINPASARPPADWTGWPDGKQFAFVLTHDVEGPEGLAKCRKLAELEMSLGFRSSFNFIPEGPYAVPAELRAWLTTNGFEVGVHDLKHDGHLFSSRGAFARRAARINHFLRDWGAVGFRAGFMLRNLDWLHDLSIAYDASTFDTDPFEPQSEGAETIFPYWISPPSSVEGRHPSLSASAASAHLPPLASASRGTSPQGYLELPYTLPQDSTLFLLLRESSPEIWLRKLDWIAGHGGMGLVNVHPDYVAFDGKKPSSREFPSSLYREFLHYVLKSYAGRYWNPLPRDLATWYTRNASGRDESGSTGKFVSAAKRVQTSGILSGKRAAVLLYSNYPADPRPRRAAETMVEAGMEVDLLCLSEKEDDATVEAINGVRTFRVPMQRQRAGRRTYLWQYGRFIFSAFWFLLRNSLRRRYDLVHVHNMPDVLVFAAVVPKLLGAKIILDLHDPMPELMMAIFNAPVDGKQVRFLRALEKWSIRFSDSVITVNEACRRIFSLRSCPGEKVGVVMNAPDENIFGCREHVPALPGPGRPFRIMYHGSLVARHGLDLAVIALRQVIKDIPAAELHVYGRSTPFVEAVLNSVRTDAIASAIIYHGATDLPGIVRAIDACDVGVIPNRRSIFTEINTPTRIFEYLSRGKPVIAPRSQGILDYFGPDDLVYFNLGDADELAEKLAFVNREPARVSDIVARGQTIYRNHSWTNERARFLRQVTMVLHPDSEIEDEAGDLTPCERHGSK